MFGIQFLTDEKGRKVAVQICFRKHGALWEDFYDGLVSEQRRTAFAGIKARIGNHIFRATGVTACLKNSGKLEITQQITNHESPRTTKLYDRRQDKISLDEVERIAI